MSEWTGIVGAEAERHSGRGPYRAMVARFGKFEGPGGSPPKVVSDLVLAALRAKRPRTRYSGGLMARPLLLLRRTLSDRMFDRLIGSALD